MATAVNPGGGPTPENRDPFGAWAGIGIFISALLIFCLLAPPFSVPGRWAAIASSFSGLESFRPVTRPVWSGLVAALSALPIANLGRAINLLSAVIGALTCWALFSLTRGIPYKRGYRGAGRIRDERWPKILAGLVAATFAIVSPPMLIVSTRGDHAVLDLLLLIVPFLPALRFLQRPRSGLLLLACLLFGLGLVENPVALFTFPLFAIWWMLLLYLNRLLRMGVLLLGGLALLAAPLALVGYAWIMLQTESSVLREFATPWAVLSDFFRIYKVELLHGVPRVGWFLIFLLNLLPFLIVLLRKLDEPNDRITTLGVYAFRLVLVALAMVTLFNLPGAPQRVIGDHILLLAPTMIVAIWFGFLVGYQSGVWLSGRHRWLAAVPLVAWLSAAGYAGALRVRAAQTGTLEETAAMARHIVDSLGRRDILVTDGSVDASLLLAARQANHPVRVINLQAVPQREYARAAARALQRDASGAETPTGPLAVVNGLLADEPNAADRLAILTNPDSLRATGRIAAPIGWFHALVQIDDLPNARELLALNEALPAPTPPPAPVAKKAKTTANLWSMALFKARWSSRLANDVGVYLEEAGLGELAESAYQRALLFWPDNASAAINLLERARGRSESESTRCKQTLKTLLAREPNGRHPGFRAQFGGRVRDFIARETDGVQLTGEDPLERALARSAQQARQPTATARRGAPDPGTIPAATNAPTPEQRRELEERIAAHLQEARVAAREGNWQRANTELNLAYELAPLRPDVLAAAGQLYLMQSEFGLALNCWQVLQLQFPQASPVQTLHGATLLYRGDTEEAESMFNEILAQTPQEFGARFYLAAIRIQQGRIDEARAVWRYPSLADLVRGLDSILEERALLTRVLGADGYTKLAGVLAGNSTIDAAQIPEVQQLAKRGMAAMASLDWVAASTTLLDAINKGLRAPAVVYNHLLAMYHQQPTADRLNRIEKLVNTQEGQAFAKAFAYLCLQTGDYSRAERALALFADSTDDESLLMRAACLAGTEQASEAWRILNGIPADRRPRLTSWFTHDISAIRRLAEDVRFSAWKPAQADSPTP